MKKTVSLHINTERTWRGGEKQTLALVEGLNARGHRAELACPPGSPLEQRARDAGITVHPIKMRGEADVRAISKLRKLLKETDYDVCQMHTSHAHALGVLARGLRRNPLTIVNRRVDFSIHRRGMFGLNALKYRHGVDRFIAISHAIRQVLVDDGIDGDNIEVVHSGVPSMGHGTVDREEIRKSLGITPEHTLIGNVAHLAGHKGQLHLIEATALLHERFPHVRTVIVGDGKERETLEKAIAENQLEGIVTLAGFQKDVASYLNAFDIFVMPSIMEGLCTSILDALLSDLPVVGSNTGGIPEIIRDGETGLLARPGDSEHLAARLAELVESPELGRKLAAAGRAHVESGFSVDQMVEGTLGVYDRLLEK